MQTHGIRDQMELTLQAENRVLCLSPLHSVSPVWSRIIGCTTRAMHVAGDIRRCVREQRLRSGSC
jgi:hypothetical protein